MPNFLSSVSCYLTGSLRRINPDSLVTQSFQHHSSVFWKLKGYVMTNLGFRTCFIALLIISVIADGAPKRGLGANDDVLITVSAICSLM